MKGPKGRRASTSEHSPINRRAPFARARAANARRSALFPPPASPPTSTVVPSPRVARSSSDASRSSSGARPTISGQSTRRSAGAAADTVTSARAAPRGGPGAASRHSTSKIRGGDAIPFRESPSRSRIAGAPSRGSSARTSSLTRSSPAPAPWARRAATITAPPTNCPSCGIGSPAWTPTPTRIGRSGLSFEYRSASRRMPCAQVTAARAEVKTT